MGWFVLGAAAWVVAEPIASLRATNYVNDFAGVLDAATEARLNDLCHQVEQKANAQIAVVTVKSLDGQDVVSYAVALYQKFGIGAKGKDRGVLILLATNDRKYWTTVGYGLEGILPDGKVGGFGREAVPLLRDGNYAGAVTLMTVRVASGDCAGCWRHTREPAADGAGSAATASAERWGHWDRHSFSDRRFCRDSDSPGAVWRQWWTAGRRWWRRVRISAGDAAEFGRRRRISRRGIWWWGRIWRRRRFWWVWRWEYWRRRGGWKLVRLFRLESNVVRKFSAEREV